MIFYISIRGQLSIKAKNSLPSLFKNLFKVFPHENLSAAQLEIISQMWMFSSYQLVKNISKTRLVFMKTDAFYE